MSLRAGQINGCGFCVDVHAKDAAAAGETPLRLNLVAAWREATVFNEAERAALALAEEGTRLADAHHGMSDETWAQLHKHYDDDQIAALVCLVAARCGHVEGKARRADRAHGRDPLSGCCRCGRCGWADSHSYRPPRLPS